jgi:hypothetical protein
MDVLGSIEVEITSISFDLSRCGHGDLVGEFPDSRDFIIIQTALAEQYEFLL